MRIAGFGYGDDSLENNIAQVQVGIKFSSDVEKNAKKMQSGITFDLLVFKDEKDYLCYVEAVELLRRENKKQACNFIYNKELFLESMYTKEFVDEEFLKLKQKAKELFFVIDNTDYPEVILYDKYVPRPYTGNPNVDYLYVDVRTTTTFTSNDTFYFWNWVFIILIGSLSGLLLLTILCYFYKVMRYNSLVKERRQLKQQLMEIKDTEYTNFLMRQSENIKN